MSLHERLRASILEDPTKLPHYEGITRAIRDIVNKANLVTMAQIYIHRGRDAVSLIDQEVPANEQGMTHIEAKNFWMGVTMKMIHAQKLFQAKKDAGTLPEPTPEFRAQVLESITPKSFAEGRKQFEIFEKIVAELDRLAALK